MSAALGVSLEGLGFVLMLGVSSTRSASLSLGEQHAADWRRELSVKPAADLTLQAATVTERLEDQIIAGRGDGEDLTGILCSLSGQAPSLGGAPSCEGSRRPQPRQHGTALGSTSVVVRTGPTRLGLARAVSTWIDLFLRSTFLSS